METLVGAWDGTHRLCSDPRGPAWGWRSALAGDDDDDGGSRQAMWNVPPEGTDERAVDARFRRGGGT